MHSEIGIALGILVAATTFAAVIFSLRTSRTRGKDNRASRPR
jgi:hypothetical protein